MTPHVASPRRRVATRRGERAVITDIRRLAQVYSDRVLRFRTFSGGRPRFQIINRSCLPNGLQLVIDMAVRDARVR